MGSLADEERAEAQEMIKAMAFAFESIIAKKDASVAPTWSEVTLFHGLHVPPISILAYMSRIESYAQCSPECWVLAFVLIDRLLSANPDVVLSAYNAHRLLLTAMLLAIKGRDDSYYSNAVYASVGGVTTRELNELELYFLRLVQYDLFVKPSEFNYYQERLLGFLAENFEGSMTPTSPCGSVGGPSPATPAITFAPPPHAAKCARVTA